MPRNWRLVPAVALALAIATALIDCSTDSTLPTGTGGGGAAFDTTGLDMAREVTAVIDSRGGWLAGRARDGSGLRVVVPADAVPTARRFRAIPYRHGPGADSLGWIGSAWYVEPKGETFRVPVEVTLDLGGFATPSPVQVARVFDDGTVALVPTEQRGAEYSAVVDHFSGVGALALTDTVLVRLWRSTIIDIALHGLTHERVERLAEIYTVAQGWYPSSPLIDFAEWHRRIHGFTRELYFEGVNQCESGECAAGRHLLRHVSNIASMMLEYDMTARADSAEAACRDVSVSVRVDLPLDMTGCQVTPADSGVVIVDVRQSDGSPSADARVNVWLEGAGTLLESSGITGVDGTWTTIYLSPSYPPDTPPVVHASVSGACDPTIEATSPVGVPLSSNWSSFDFVTTEIAASVYVCCDSLDNEFYDTRLVRSGMDCRTGDCGTAPRSVGTSLTASVSSPIGHGRSSIRCSGSGSSLSVTLEGAGKMSCPTLHCAGHDVSWDGRVRGCVIIRSATGLPFPPGTRFRVRSSSTWNATLVVGSVLNLAYAGYDDSVYPPGAIYEVTSGATEARLSVSFTAGGSTTWSRRTWSGSLYVDELPAQGP